MLNQPRLLFLIAFACLTCACPSQRVVMPGGAGGVTPPVGWTVLRNVDLEADERATDPTGEPARARILAKIASLRHDGLTDQHLLLHQQVGQGAGQTTRLVQAYSAAGGATTGELLERIESVRDVLERAFRDEGDEVAFQRGERSPTFDQQAVELVFERTREGRALTHTHFLVPAGDRIQDLDASWDRGDDGADAAVRALLQTFDGRADPASGAGNLWIAGVAGALAGVVTALARRKRQARALAANRS